MSVKRCFDPVVDDRTRVLVLGSLPGERSLVHQQYYANERNSFWRLLAEVTGQALPALDYPARLQALLDHGIGLWDVVAQADRQGSLDQHIRDHVGNDLPGLISQLPCLAAIAFNGGTAARLGRKVLGGHAAHLALLHLPSSSPAHTQPYAAKLDAWQALREYVAPPPASGERPG